MVLQNFKNHFAFLGFLIYVQTALPAKILLVTDQASQDRASEVKIAFETTPPFSLLQDFTVEIKLLPKGSVKCTLPFLAMNDPSSDISKSNIPASCKKMFADAKAPETNSEDIQKKNSAALQVSDASRLMVCDPSEALIAIAGEINADRIIFIKDSEEWQGAGGAFITMTTNMPTLTAIHETLHSFGFADEYQFTSPCEADTYCPYYIESSLNITVFKDYPPYESDSIARSRHQAQIPWYNKIKPATLITNGTELGSTAQGAVGLYRSNVCDQSELKVKTWKSGNEVSVMENMEVSHIPEIFWPLIANQLNSKIIDKEPATNKKIKPYNIIR